MSTIADSLHDTQLKEQVHRRWWQRARVQHSRCKPRCTQGQDEMSKKMVEPSPQNPTPVISADKRLYKRVTHDGKSCICEPSEVANICSNLGPYEITDVWMSPEDYEKLPEFEGY